MFAMMAAAFLMAAVSGTSQAAPIAPLPAGVANDHAGLTQVYWRRPYGRRHCWIGRWGHWHCW
jgi:hypothetical protein